MSSPSLSGGPRIVEVVINSRFSQAIALGKRRASVAFSSLDKSMSAASPSPSTEDEDDSSDFARSNEESEEDRDTEDSTVESWSNGIRPSRSETPSDRPFRCTYPDCVKTYAKPSRLAEHIRSHTGERPYGCSTCGKSYLRESHLQAHARSHLPASDRPFACTYESCPKRFWTAQHLQVHIASVHKREKPFKCSEDGCDKRFVKHNQVKKHVADMHRPSGTKPYPCVTQGCNQTFSTNQKLRKHSRVHEGNRYACADVSCMTSTTSGPSSSLYFPTWSALQAHIRECHRPMCHHPDCGGRAFASQKGLRGHLKVHEEREIEATLEKAVGVDKRPSKRRRGGEVGRDWRCEVEGCTKAFKSKKALTTHHNITHLGRRDFVCQYLACGQAFGYKHLLQRHTAKVHATEKSTTVAHVMKEPSPIGWITGANYTSASAHNNTRRPLVPCPWPDRIRLGNLGVHEEVTVTEASVGRCAYIFSRAYDLRRHLKTDHGLEFTKDEMDNWVRDWRERHVDTI